MSQHKTRKAIRQCNQLTQTDNVGDFYLEVKVKIYFAFKVTILFSQSDG